MPSLPRLRDPPKEAAGMEIMPMTLVLELTLTQIVFGQAYDNGRED